MVKKAIPKKVKKSIQNYIKHLKDDGLPIDDVILFGSQAKGKAHKWSDIDLCVISPAFGDKIVNPIDYLWIEKSEKDINSMIAPVGFHPKDFIDEDPLAWEIKQTGIRVV